MFTLRPDHRRFAVNLAAVCHGSGCNPDFFGARDSGGLGIETTITAAELCAIGTWERAGGGYRILDWEAVETALDSVRQRTGEDPSALAADQDHQAKIQACTAKPMLITPPCAACKAPTAHIELLLPPALAPVRPDTATAPTGTARTWTRTGRR